MTFGKFLTGKFRPNRPDKYHGDVNNITYRSSYELAAFRFMDDEDAILKWNSEETVIPYISSVDGRAHRYFLDLTAIVRGPDGKPAKKYIEIKPYDQTIEPRKTPKEQDQAFAERVRTWLVNQSKWEAARAYAKRNNGDFIILTEREIFPQNHSIKPYRHKSPKAAKPAAKPKPKPRAK
ncbi:gp4 head completion protein [Delftia phage PhiW-14]|uniref:Head completion nuclease n=1 Tax=Delftia phage PhiW-14 TaxID=665032 RepID=C9DFY1_BPW14|nr:head closure [Delftia phage PhiW-14]ACV50032.1 gp4 head completion protein [Delftia phage PhiW-14]